MAKFKVGDRVKKVRMSSVWTQVAPIGAEGTVIGFTDTWGEYCLLVRYDKYLGTGWGAPNCIAADWQLEPLTPTAIDQWASEQVRKVTQPVTEVPKVKV